MVCTAVGSRVARRRGFQPAAAGVLAASPDVAGTLCLRRGGVVALATARMGGVLPRGRPLDALPRRVLVLLAATTPFSEIVRVLREWRVPALLLTTLTLMDRYLFVLVEESGRMQRARMPAGHLPRGRGGRSGVRWRKRWASFSCVRSSAPGEFTRRCVRGGGRDEDENALEIHDLVVPLRRPAALEIRDLSFRYDEGAPR